MRWTAVAVVAFATRVAGASPLATDADARARLATALTEIEGHVHALRYTDARNAARRALAIGAATPDEVATLARILGETSAALDDKGEAVRWFTLWLELRPGDDLPAGSSPKLTAPLASARVGVRSALTVRVIDRYGSVTVQVLGDAAHAVASIEIDGVHNAIAADRPEIDVPLRAGRFAYSLRDRHGNELLIPHDHEIVAQPFPSGALRIVPRRSLWRRPPIYIAAGAVTAALGGVFLWRRSVARDDLADIIAHSDDHTFGDADAARTRAETYGWLSVASFAATGAIAVTGLVLSLRSDQPVTVIPTPGGFEIVSSFSW